MGNLQSVKMNEILAKEVYKEAFNSRVKKEQKSLTDFQLQAPDLEETKDTGKAKQPEPEAQEAASKPKPPVDTYVPTPKVV
jgi:hypothetical protein